MLKYLIKQLILLKEIKLLKLCEICLTNFLVRVYDRLGILNVTPSIIL